MKITDLKCAIIGQNPVVRITTDEGIDGYGEAESPNPISSRMSSSTNSGLSARIPPTSSA
jgi:L-alanine-DL-glutamate epimerase-like enolase superfamily enzyme